MAGHSKWANIKHRKGAQDAKRGKIFTRIIKEITIAVKESGNDPSSNPRLRNAISNAKGENMPKDNIDRAIKKASGDDANTYSEVTFEGYANGGVAVFVECTTDNINRTVADVRSIFNKNGGSLGKNGSLEFIFDRKGVFVIDTDKNSIDLEKVEMELIDSGLEESYIDENTITLYTSFVDFGLMQNKLEEMNIEVKQSSLDRIPNTTTKLDLNEAKKVLNLINKFEDDNDDVQNVFHNLEMTSEIEDYLNQ
ncbi:YebC/PmpR family DNA-binding transcriptional regulator [Ichthyobacterium seriolicida]|uniref:Probable transcriptional regulatory protein JBKA6_1283 n=1 Tax=Ichthyobacterium seriolicida TaxID=242600 RepID=A0A1J1ECR7_9FLAO|nr:YebC/PmpR family DNA-binding transcriptional regulator [Ichthyobacterium seriolicida]BAV95296.1 hypothetical protein JBKA6_1283 [Ichthyobacterium seriolicida]